MPKLISDHNLWTSSSFGGRSYSPLKEKYQEIKASHSNIFSQMSLLKTYAQSNDLYGNWLAWARAKESGTNLDHINTPLDETANTTESSEIILPGPRDQLNSKNLMYPQPEQILTPLFQHQKTALYQMVEFEKADLKTSNSQIMMKKNVGILADKPGAGKTLTVLSLLTTTHQIKDYWTSKYSCLNLLPEKYIDCHVIVTPNNILHQWEECIKKYTTLQYQILNSDIWNLQDNYVYLVPESKCWSLMKQNIRVKRVIIDEIDTMQIPLYSYDIVLTCDFMWLITATPARLLDQRYDLTSEISGRAIRNLENVGLFVGRYQYINRDSNYHYQREIYRSLHGIGKVKLEKYIHALTFPYFMFLQIDQKYFNELIIRNLSSYVDESIPLPKPIINQILCKMPVVLKILSGINLTEIENCLFAHDLESLGRILKCDIIQPRNIIQKITSDLLKSNQNCQQLLDNLQKLDPETYNSSYTIPYDVKFQELSNKIASNLVKIDSIKTRLEQIETDSCIICYDNFVFENSKHKSDNPPILLNCCNHLICAKCLAQIKITYNQCVVCRSTNIQVTILADFNQSNIKPVEKTEDVVSDKIETLIKIITNEPTGKFLIFSSVDASFTNIITKLNETPSLKYFVLNRQASDVSSQLDSFKNGDTNILLLNAVKHGAGLNLENASDLIIFHKLDKFTTEQVIGRAQRCGRTLPLRIHYLKYPNE